MSHDNRLQNQQPRNKQPQQGFTLLELLVAIVIFAIMSVMAYGGLNNVINNSEAATRSLQRLQQLQQAISVLNRDFNQLRKRNIRDEYGVRKAWLLAGNNIDNLVAFTRGGRLNPANLKRSSLERVAYRFEDNKLIRLQWPFLDRAPGSEPDKYTLLDNINTVSLRYADKNHAWHEQWPPLNSTATTADGKTLNTAVLTAIEIKIKLNDLGEIRRLYAVLN